MIYFFNISSCLILFSLIIYIVKRQGIGSFEGIGLILYGLVLIPASLAANLFNTERIISNFTYSNLVHSLGFISLFIGLISIKFLADKTTELRTEEITYDIYERLNQYSSIGIVLGILFSFIGYWTSGFSLLDLIFIDKSSYLLEKGFLGGWIDKGKVLFDISVIYKIL